MKMAEIRELSEKERGEKFADIQEEYFNLKFQLATGKIENPGNLRHMRRDMARIKTLATEIKRQGGSAPVQPADDAKDKKPEAKKVATAKKKAATAKKK